MSLRDEITEAISEAFDTDLADAVSEFTGSRLEATGPPNPITQVQPSQTYTYNGRGVFGSYDMSVVDGLQILRTDVKLTTLQVELTAYNGELIATPKVDDELQKVNSGGMPYGLKYRIINVGQDPASSTWVLQIRGT